MRAWLLLSALLAACDPYADWPDPHDLFPYVYTPESGLEPFETVRWETETWDPLVDQEEAGLYLKKLLTHKRGAPDEVLEHFRQMKEQVPAVGRGARLSLVGDVMWVGGNWNRFATPSAALLDGDLRVGNLETPVSPDHPTSSMALGIYAFNAPVEMLQTLPLDLLQLNNNHSLDADDLGLENTLAQVQKAGYRRVGVDAQSDETVAGLRVALLSYTWGVNDGRRSKKGHELHVVPFGHLGQPIDLGMIERQVGEARDGGAEAVVVLLHWGFEFEYYPDPHFMVLARRIIAAGADLIVGQGPHVVQPVEICHVNRPEHVPGVGTCSLRTDDGRARTAAVLYSLGDFGTTLPSLQHKVGLVATASLDADGVGGLGWAAVASESLPDGAGQSVKPLAGLAQGNEGYAEELERLEKHLGAGWRR